VPEAAAPFVRTRWSDRPKLRLMDAPILSASRCGPSCSRPSARRAAVNLARARNYADSGTSSLLAVMDHLQDMQRALIFVARGEKTADERAAMQEEVERELRTCGGVRITGGDGGSRG
jgi:hypothetical protein